MAKYRDEFNVGLFRVPRWKLHSLYFQPIDQKWKGLTSSIEGMWQSVFNKEDFDTAEEIRLVQITMDMINIRKTPSLNGKVITTGYVKETYHYQNEEKIDTYIRCCLANY